MDRSKIIDLYVFFSFLLYMWRPFSKPGHIILCSITRWYRGVARYKPLITAKLYKGFSRAQGFIHLCEWLKPWFKPSACLHSWNNFFFFFLPSEPQNFNQNVSIAAHFDICAQHLLVKTSLKIVLPRNNLCQSYERTSAPQLRKMRPSRLSTASHFRKGCLRQKSLVTTSDVTKGTATESHNQPSVVFVAF